MHALGAILAALIVAIQWPLWFGKGGWLRAWELERRLAEQRTQNAALEARNAALAAEVRDLKQGTDAIEERARYEFGLVRDDEVYFRIVTRR